MDVFMVLTKRSKEVVVSHVLLQLFVIVDSCLLQAMQSRLTILGLQNVLFGKTKNTIEYTPLHNIVYARKNRKHLHVIAGQFA